MSLRGARESWYCFNSTFDPANNSDIFYSVFAVSEASVTAFHIIVSAPGVLSNLLLLSMIFGVPNLRAKPVNVLVAALLINDLVTCLVIAPTAVYLAHNPEVLTSGSSGCHLCFVMGLLITIICTCSGNILMMIAVERFFYGYHTAWHTKYFSHGATWYQVIATWVLQIVGNVIAAMLGLIGYKPFPKIRFCLVFIRKYLLPLAILVMMAFAIVFAVCTFCYVKMWLNRKAVQNKNVNAGQHVMVTAVYFLTWTPVMIFLKTPFSFETDPFDAFVYFSTLFISAEVKSMIYLLANKDFRTAAKHWLSMGVMVAPALVGSRRKSENAHASQRISEINAG